MVNVWLIGQLSEIHTIKKLSLSENPVQIITYINIFQLLVAGIIIAYSLHQVKFYPKKGEANWTLEAV